jgi:hypothetical protein
MSTPTPFPLGRKQYHDPRNAEFAIGERPSWAVSSASWQRRVPIFDQGQLGSCVGNSAAGWVATDNADRSGLQQVVISQSLALTGSGSFDGNYRTAVTVSVDETLAVRTYSLATTLDSFTGTYPPDDTGTDGPSGAKALTKLGLAGQYLHAFSLAALQSALQKGPVMWGTVWYNSMFDLDSNNYLVVKPSSGEAGGHEPLIVAWDKTTDVYKVANSWATSWGDGGYFYVKAPDMKSLLSKGGDLTQPVSVPVSPPPPATVTDAQFYAAFKDFRAVATAWASSRSV